MASSDRLDDRDIAATGCLDEITQNAESRPLAIARLRSLASDYRLLVFQAAQLRELRDGLALRLIDGGATWREVAEAAGFENPYIAQLKRKREDSDAAK